MTSAEEPPQSSPVRLFVGNLVPSITDVALLRLFSRFGDTSDLERSTGEGFAHLSVKPKDGKAPNDIDHAVKSLNRTTWCGTTLRVERAREHFLDRLKREWAEERNDGCTDMDDEKQQPPADHFANHKKGKHTTFSFPDVEFGESVLGVEKDDEVAVIVENSREDAAELSEPEANARTAKAPKGPAPVKSARLDSTLALFGLASTEVARPPRATQSANDNKRDRTTRELSPAKRPRSSSKDKEEHTDEANDDPSVVDIDAEKDKARRVLQKLFPESEATPIVSCRRLGLYRKLLQAPDDGPNRETRSETQVDFPMLDTAPSRRNRPESGRATADKFRKAGLYKMLTTPTS